jgi:hypothetical protein
MREEAVEEGRRLVPPLTLMLLLVVVAAAALRLPAVSLFLIKINIYLIYVFN